MTAHVMARPIGLLLGLNLSFNPFSLHPTYRTLSTLPLNERVAQLQRPEIRAAILSEVPQAIDTDQALLRYIASFDYMFSLGDPPNYVPKASDSIGAKSKRLRVDRKNIRLNSSH